MVETTRLHLIPATVEIARAEIRARESFARLLCASVPDNWPPEALADALPLLLDLLERHATWAGWLGWYAVTNCEAAELVGSVGFKGPPDPNGCVEIGYSVLPQYQRQGFATEMVRGLVQWARTFDHVRCVVAQTDDRNIASRRVLAKLGFVAVGPGEEANSRRYEQSVERD